MRVCARTGIRCVPWCSRRLHRRRCASGADGCEKASPAQAVTALWCLAAVVRATCRRAPPISSGNPPTRQALSSPPGTYSTAPAWLICGLFTVRAWHGRSSTSTRPWGALFGVGRGRVLLRAVAFELADAISVPSRAPVTREGVHAERNAAELVKNYRVYHTAMKAKMELAREGSGARSLTSLVDIGRRLSAVDFVVFLTIFRDGNTSCVRPLNTMAQRAGEDGGRDRAADGEVCRAA